MEIFQGMPLELRETIARILMALLALLIIWGLRGMFSWVVLKPLRALTGRTHHKFDDLLVDAVDQPIRWVTLAVALMLSAHILGLGAEVITFINRLGRTLIIAAAFIVVFQVIDELSVSQQRLYRIVGLNVNPQLLPFISTGVKIIVFTIALVVVIQEWGYNVSGLIAGLGLGGLAFSLAAQDTVSNLFGFSTIVGDGPFSVGEFIVTPEVAGIVEAVGIRSTRVRQLDQALVTVPNGRLANSVITNWSRLKKRRIDFTVGVTYGTTADQMEALLQDLKHMLHSRQLVETDSVQVMFSAIGDSSLNILLRGYILLSDWYEWMQELEKIYLDIMRIVEKHGLSIAFPSRSLYIESVPPQMWNTGQISAGGSAAQGGEKLEGEPVDPNESDGANVD